jgi:hypothetical protein
MARGRRPLDEQDVLSASLHVRLSARRYDELYADARHARVSVPELVRRRLRTRRDEARDDEDDDDR